MDWIVNVEKQLKFNHLTYHNIFIVGHLRSTSCVVSYGITNYLGHFFDVMVDIDVIKEKYSKVKIFRKKTLYVNKRKLFFEKDTLDNQTIPFFIACKISSLGRNCYGPYDKSLEVFL